jgi:hypothetical protein
MFALIVAVKLTTNLDAGCGLIGIFTLIFSSAILHQLIEFKKDLNKFACPACTDDSLCHKLCTSTKLYTIVAVVISLVMAISLLSFIVLAENFFLLIIGMDIFVFHYLFTHWNSTNTNELVQDAKKVGAEVIINFLNILLLIVMLVALELMYIKDVQMSPEIFGTINEQVQHSCKVFQHILRTKEFTDSSIYAIRNIDGIGNILFTFFYISTISIFPMTAITLLFKFGIKTEYRFFRKKQD